MDELKRKEKQLLDSLKERQKELNCIHGLEGILIDFESPLENILYKILRVLPDGFQFPEKCFAEIEYNGKSYKTSKHENTIYMQKSPLHKNNINFGELRIYYTDVPPEMHHEPFLKEEYSLLNTIASILASYLVVRSYKEKNIKNNVRSEWQVIVNMLQKTDIKLFLRIARKLLNLLFQKGIEEVKSIYASFGDTTRNSQLELSSEINAPLKKKDYRETIKLSDQIFEIAASHFSDNEMMDFIRKWIQEDKLNFLTISLESPDSTLSVIQDAIYRYQNQEIHKDTFSPYAYTNVKVLMIQKLFTNQLEFINVAKNYIDLEDFQEVLQHTIFSGNSHGKLGGKSTGLFFANNILKRETENEFFKNIKTPQTWYITSDTMLNFLHYNNLEEVVEQKYKDIEIVRAEYGNIIQMFKNSHFPHEVAKGLSQLLDGLGNRPIIVRSSSLLEDSFGAAFSGKYKSLFLANQGSKQERLNALKDAIAEVYASIVGPDPIEYRKERGLLDFKEEMAILIQEVVGEKCGKYFFPAFAGVAFSNNEFRWSSRIKREDGLLRLVPGLGTRAVDRLSNDYPVLASPGKPGIRVNASTEEILKYSPKEIDLINLETNSFETMSIDKLLQECRDDFPLYDKLFSVYEHNYFTEKSGFSIDFDKDDLIPTFNGLINNTSFMKKIKTILDILKAKLSTPVDIELAVKNDDIYLLQCRPQSFSSEDEPQPIPQDIPAKDVIFSAHKHISNGYIPEINYIVYVDPDCYTKMETIDELRRVGRCIGKLNLLLPKKKFILLGPGRWGSKGDIKLGVNVSYSDINKTAVLIEIAREKGNYVPDLSFGTHFFQDLVEAQIRYIPLYPDEKENIFNNNFFRFSNNILPNILPEYEDIQKCVKVIDIPKETDGKILKIFMNADLEEAIAYVGKPGNHRRNSQDNPEYFESTDENYWYWRLQVAEYLAQSIDSSKLGVKNMYLFGSVKNANAGPASDIDILVHFKGNKQQMANLQAWLEGWSICLDHFNYLKTGYKTGGLLDVHIITDDDIEKQTSYAAKIGAVTDAARKLEMNK
ncbi:MAG: nucleotidyltransferase domain-containing protein [Candidatus Cloacimonetes bacterium]|nr:nucleotidyltransferase domain-containing protein [Candidatus Cloacimonadota bacterium]MCF7812921.1 nucleotidyltransferase domain-containing protein [Candidatus Cloacimonadota bacterium]MCF7867133.1 nucleotidyltransferase domain-containing protein [Candidatus Cloacimonadota bacterium]MCF7882547.1 nucleotidyltransferase domain-containing protein [Candidatus Cloacimonadota bacterium]